MINDFDHVTEKEKFVRPKWGHEPKRVENH